MWVVSRQRQWPEGDLCVEISGGSIDYMNPGAYTRKYPGELEEYTDPRRAVVAAFKIAKAWKADLKGKEHVSIGRGSTGGYTMFFQCEPVTRKTYDAYRKWADKVWMELPKCAQCGCVLAKDKFRLPDDYDTEYCSENCANMAYEKMYA